MSRKLFKATTLVMSMTLLSRITGFIRDMMTAHLFGATGDFDAFTVAFKIPNFMRRLFAEGSFSQAFIPVLTTYQKQYSRAEVCCFINAMAGTLSLILFNATLIGLIVTPWLIHLFAPGFTQTGQRFALAVLLLRMTFPYLFLISLTAFAGAILNTYHHFGAPAFTPVFLNLCMIAAAIYLPSRLTIPITSLAIGVLAAGIIQLLFQCPFLQKIQLLPRPTIDFHHIGVRRVLAQMIPALFGVSVGQINLLVDTLFASLLAIGSLSWLYYADRLMEFPLGILGIATTTVILPYLSTQHASQSHQQFSSTLDWALRLVCTLGIPATIGLMLASGPLLSTLLQYGQFNEHSVLMTRRSLIAFSIGIMPFMFVKIFSAGFYAKQNIRTPIQIGIIAMIANIIFNILLIKPLAHAGIALATTLSAWINAGCLFYLLRRNHHYQPRTGWKIFSTRLLLANGFLSVWLWLGMKEWNTWLTHSAWWRVTHLSAWILSSVLIYTLILWVSGMRLTHFLQEQ